MEQGVTSAPRSSSDRSVGSHGRAGAYLANLVPEPIDWLSGTWTPRAEKFDSIGRTDRIVAVDIGAAESAEKFTAKSESSKFAR